MAGSSTGRPARFSSTPICEAKSDGTSSAPPKRSREIAAHERTVVEAPPSGEPAPPTLYLGMDGHGDFRAHGGGRGHAGKQPDGSTKTREVRLCTV